jgi:hypothetical protein
VRCAVLGEGRVVLYECDLWSEAVEWLRGYTDSDTGGWSWFEISKDGVVQARYVVSREEEMCDDAE